jgi:hypothetical protein
VKRGARALAYSVALAAIAGSLAAIHPPSSETGAALDRGDTELLRARSNTVAAAVASGLERSDYPTGSARFDGEWLLVTHVMAALGHAKLAERLPESDEIDRAERAIDRLLAPDVRGFDREAWAHDALDDLGSERAHLAYLGYTGLALAVVESAAVRATRPTPHRALRRAIAEHLAARYAAVHGRALETYPGEAYPPDNAAALAAVAVSRRLDRGDAVEALLDSFFERYRDPATGLLFQAVDPASDLPSDTARGSGTLFASYLISFASEQHSRALYLAGRDRLFVEAGGFGAMHEFAGRGAGDIDSGPVVFGLGVSATGFGIGAARANGDSETFVRLYATAHFAGLPICTGDRCSYLAGGALGDAILFAMVTAGPAGSAPPLLNASLEPGR